MRAAVVRVYLDVPLQMAPKAEWVLTSLLAACGAQLEVVDARASDEARASCALAYAPAPAAGVPTIPLAEKALDLIAERRPLASQSFAPFETAAGPLPGGFPVSDEGFAAPFDLVASAFVLLAAWDEATSDLRDEHGRFPYAQSLFARNDALELTDPPLDGYLRLLRELVNERLANLGEPVLTAPGWGSAAGEGEGEARFALALTHDVDDVRRWSPRDYLVGGKRTALALRHRDLATARLEAGDLGRAATRATPYGDDPYWVFPEILRREHELGGSSTFYVLASHGHPTDGERPELYQRRLPAVLRTVRTAGREVGLHGNHRDGRELEALLDDRNALAELTGAPVDGMRLHYLKCTYHETLPLLDRAGFVYDTSLAYAESEGPRCGFSFPFHPYDLRADRPLDLIELPLLVMDSTLLERKYRGLSADEACKVALGALEKLRDAGGAAAVLWHHNRFHRHLGRGYGDVYWDLLYWARAEGGALLSAGDLVPRYRERAGETTL